MEQEKKEQEIIEQPIEKQADVVIERHRTPSVKDTMPGPGKLFKLIFGLIMVVIYVGMGLWLSGWVDFGFPFQFGLDGTEFEWIKYVVGVALIAYGFFRAYRYFKGDYYSKRD